MSKLLGAAERLRRGEPAARVDVGNPRSELGRLGEAFNAMAADLGSSLQYKDMLLRELSHRVMNSLQTTASLFMMQAGTMKDAEARGHFDQAVSRINSVALAYRRLHASRGVELVEFAIFIRELCAEPQSSMLPDRSPIKVEADPILLSPDQAMP